MSRRTLEMEAARSSEMLVSNHHTTRRNNPEKNKFSACLIIFLVMDRLQQFYVMTQKDE
jgi:hypothetical protein